MTRTMPKIRSSASEPVLHRALPDDPQGKISDMVLSLSRSKQTKLAKLPPPYSVKLMQERYSSSLGSLPLKGRHACMQLHPDRFPSHLHSTTTQKDRFSTFSLTGVPCTTTTSGFAKPAASSSPSRGRLKFTIDSLDTRTFAKKAKASCPARCKKPSAAEDAEVTTHRKGAAPGLPAIIEQPFDVSGAVVTEVFASSGAALIRVGYLRFLARQGCRLPRFQELPEGPPQEYRDLRASASVRGEDIRRCLTSSDLFVVSHAWLTYEHPDPVGTRLEELVDEFAILKAQDTDLVFIDFCSLPQVDRLHPDWQAAFKAGSTLPANHPAMRTEQQERDFDSIVSQMDAVFGSGFSKVIILSDVHELDELDPVYSENKRLYRQRGWCCFEFAVASFFDRIVSEAPKEMASFSPLALPELVQHGRAGFTVLADANKVLQIFQRTYHAGKINDVLSAIECGHSDRCRDGISAALAARSPSVRQRVVRALGNSHCHAYTDDLMLMMQDADSAVRAEACAAVGRMGQTRKHMSAIVSLLHDSHYTVRCAALRAISAEGTAAAAEKQHHAAVAELLNDSSWEVREAAMDCLGVMGKASAMPRDTVAKCLKDDVPITSLAALNTFWRMEQGDAVTYADQVYQVAKQDRFYFVRDAATATLKHMGMTDMVKELTD